MNMTSMGVSLHLQTETGTGGPTGIPESSGRRRALRLLAAAGTATCWTAPGGAWSLKMRMACRNLQNILPMMHSTTGFPGRMRPGLCLPCTGTGKEISQRRSTPTFTIRGKRTGQASSTAMTRMTASVFPSIRTGEKSGAGMTLLEILLVCAVRSSIMKKKIPEKAFLMNTMRATAWCRSQDRTGKSGSGMSMTCMEISAGNIVGIEDGAGNHIGYALDAWGRILEIRKADGSSEYYRYDCVGNIVQSTDGEGNATFWRTPFKGAALHDILLHTEKPPYRFPHTAADGLFAEPVAVCAGADQRQHQNIILYTVDKQPVRENMTFPMVCPIAGQVMVTVLIRQRFAHRQ